MVRAPMALTRDKVFWDAFSAHAQTTVKATELLEQMLASPSDSEKLAREIADLENQGDKITHDTVLALHQTWITPLDREEIHALISKLDDVLDYVEAASERIALYEIKSSTQEARDLARVLNSSSQEVAKAVSALTNVSDSKVLLDLCVSINKHENEADTIFRKGLARLFKEHSDPLEVMKWRDIYDSLETATDRAEDVANIIEGIVLEHG
jgi:predicted phosphate transport protein (TIGR00153 family)